MTKQAVNRPQKSRSKHSLKVDRYLVSKQPHEIQRVRRIFSKDGPKIPGTADREVLHPSSLEIIALLKSYGHGRHTLYRHLRAAGYTKISRD